MSIKKKCLSIYPINLIKKTINLLSNALTAEYIEKHTVSD